MQSFFSAACVPVRSRCPLPRPRRQANRRRQGHDLDPIIPRSRIQVPTGHVAARHRPAATSSSVRHQRIRHRASSPSREHMRQYDPRSTTADRTQLRTLGAFFRPLPTTATCRPPAHDRVVAAQPDIIIEQEELPLSNPALRVTLDRPPIIVVAIILVGRVRRGPVFVVDAEDARHHALAGHAAASANVFAVPEAWRLPRFADDRIPLPAICPSARPGGWQARVRIDPNGAAVLRSNLSGPDPYLPRPRLPETTSPTFAPASGPDDFFMNDSPSACRGFYYLLSGPGLHLLPTQSAPRQRSAAVPAPTFDGIATPKNRPSRANLDDRYFQ